MVVIVLKNIMSLKSTSPVTAKLSTTSLLSEKSANCETIYYDLSSLSIQCSKKERKIKYNVRKQGGFLVTQLCREENTR